MENREILIANTKTQKRSKITTDATTLGELKAALSAAGVDYSGMTFTEGISKTQLLDDATQLPQNVMYKGQPTNNLVILLTNTKKNIASGAGDRQEAYVFIKGHGLQDEVKEKFGRNFTQVPTADLLDFINNHIEARSSENELVDDYDEDDDNEEDDDVKGEDHPTVTGLLANAKITTLVDSLLHHVTMLANEGVLKSRDIYTLSEGLEVLYEAVTEGKTQSKSVGTSDGHIMDKDIDDMISELGI